MCPYEPQQQQLHKPKDTSDIHGSNDGLDMSFASEDGQNIQSYLFYKSITSGYVY